MQYFKLTSGAPASPGKAANAPVSPDSNVQAPPSLAAVVGSPDCSGQVSQLVVPSVTSPGSSAQASQLLSQDSSDTLQGEDRPSEAKRARREGSGLRALRMQLCGVIVKDARKAELTNAVGGRWDTGNFGTISCLTGTDMVTKQLAVLVFPDGKVTNMIELVTGAGMLSVVKVAGVSSMPSPAGYETYDCYLVGQEPVTVEAATASNVMLPALVKGKVLEIHEAASTKPRDVVTLAGYMRAQVATPGRAENPGKATVLVAGNTNHEVVVNIWGPRAKEFAAQHLPVGPVFFNVTVRKGKDGLEYNCNLPHCGRPLGGPLGEEYSKKAQMALENYVQGTMTAIQVVTGEDGAVTGVVVKVVPDVESAHPIQVVVKDGELANHMFGAFIPRPSSGDRSVFKWLAECEINIDMLSASDIRGEIRVGDQDVVSKEVPVVSFKPTL